MKEKTKSDEQLEKINNCVISYLSLESAEQERIKAKEELAYLLLVHG